ncbi:DNA-3-methyladenine glycosylase 2 family protein [Deinococcus sp.]|uniref:DNA-3-methyladenine glycosylase family protein n=1 Tax=Deinococcus sp. TaxID=47478 RepID=UPI0025C1ED97|nr:DNA-3-methyladenine glycosylase 2 family protein [Deinococcus sp.]
MSFAAPLTDHASALNHLSRDPVMRAVIWRVNELTVLVPTADPLGTLIRNVTGQQLSVKAAASIHARLVEQLGEVNPDTLLRASGDELRGVGLSWAKVRTVKAIAQAAQTGSTDFARLAALPDEEIVTELIRLPGIGRWTAEMFLMFALARPDVFSLGDLALRQGLAQLHPGREPADVLALWAPHRTLAARYIWADTALLQRRGAAV